MNILRYLISLGLLSTASITYGANLIQVFQDAVIADPTFKAAEAQRLSIQQNISIARSFLLPQLSGNANALRNRIENDTKSLFVGPMGSTSVTQGTFNYGSYDLNLSAAQTLFNMGAWQNLSAAKLAAKAADANYIAAAQDLIGRVNTAYFAILFAEDNLRFIEAQKRAIYQQLDQVQQEYKVGLVAITGLYQAKASYDLVLSEEIAAKNDIVNAKENLRAITGKYYESIDGLKQQVKLISPNPNDSGAWVNIANKQNWTLQAARFTAQAAKKQVDVQFAGHFPTVNAIAGYDKQRTGRSPQGNVDMYSVNGGINLTLPIVEGGLVVAETRQAKYDYQKALDNLEKTLRDTNNFTHQSFNNIIALISKVKADRQAIISNESSLKSTSEGYRVGTETMLDVLQAVQELTDAQKIFARDQYDYINATIALKEATGTLSVSDLQRINGWLGPDSSPLNYLPNVPEHYIPKIPKQEKTDDKYLEQFTKNLRKTTPPQKKKISHPIKK
ncbi:MAG: TolC family outer membrane protein [Gammaproteobacteria bacterium]